MTRTAITVNKTTRTNKPPASVAVTKTTIDATLVTAGVNISDFFLCEDPRLEVYNSAETDETVTLKASTESNAIKADIGDYTVTVEAGTVKEIDQIEAGRFMQSGGALQVDLSTGLTGTIHATGTAKGIG
jgi:hypothetical protein